MVHLRIILQNAQQYGVFLIGVIGPLIKETIEGTGLHIYQVLMLLWSHEIV